MNRVQARLAARLALLSMILCVAAVACEKSGDAKEPPKEAFPPLGQPAKIEVMAAGDAPQQLRWKPEAGASEKLSFVVDVDTTVKAEGQSMPVTMKMEMDMNGTVASVNPDGSSVISMTVEDANMEMPALAQMGGDTSMFKDILKGLTIKSTMDPRGLTTGTEVSGGGMMADQLKGQMDDSLDQMTIPFPEEAVGKGAKWRALTTKESNNMKIRMVANYELVAFDGNKGKVKISIQQYGDPQTVNLNGMQTDLKSLKGSGSGSMEFDLKKPMFVKGKLSLKMDAKMVIMDKNASMTMKAGVSMQPKG